MKHFGKISAFLWLLCFSASAVAQFSPNQVLTAAELNAALAAARVGNGSAFTVLASQGNTSSSLAARFNTILDVVSDFGADATGINDSTSAIQAGVNAVCAAGGGTLKAAGVFKITSTITVTCSNFILQGAGKGLQHQDLTFGAGTRFLWAGASNGTLFSMAPAANTTSGKAIIGSGIKGVLFDCNGVASTCLYIGSVRGGWFDVAYNNPKSNTALTGGVVFDTIDLSEYNDTQDNDIWISGSEIGAGGRGVIMQAKSRNNKVTPYSGATPVTALGNTSYNRIYQLDLHFWTAPGLTLRETDNNVFFQYGVNGPPSVPPGYPSNSGPTGSGIELEGCGSGDTWCFNPINNLFDHGGAYLIEARGTETFAGASGNAGGTPQPNIFLHLDKGNGDGDPVVGTGAYAYFGDMQWTEQGKAIYNGVFSDSRANAIAARALAGSSGGAMFSTGTGPTVRLTSLSNGYTWGMNADTAGTLTLTPPGVNAGLGVLVGNAGGPQAQINGGAGSNPANLKAYNSSTANQSLGIASQGSATIYLATGNGISTQVTDPGGTIANLISMGGSTAGTAPLIRVYGTDTNPGLGFATQGTGAVSFYTANGEQFEIDDGGASTISHVTAKGGVSGGSPYLTAAGSASNISVILNSKGTSPVYLSTGNGIQFAALDGGSASVNYPYSYGSPTGNAVGFGVLGTDANVNEVFNTKGSGNQIFGNGHGINFQINDRGANVVNFASVTGGQAGQAPTLAMYGSDANIGFNIVTQGSGQLYVNGQIVPVLVSAPASSTSACTVGQYANSTTYHYECVSTNQWARSAQTTTGF